MRESAAVAFLEGRARLPRRLIEDGQPPTFTLRLEVDLTSGRVLKVFDSPTLPMNLEAMISRLLGAVVSTQDPNFLGLLQHKSGAAYERALQTALKDAIRQYFRYQQAVR